MEVVNIEAAQKKVHERGFLDVDIDPSLDLFKEIEKLKKEKKRHHPGTLLPGSRYTRCG